MNTHKVAIEEQKVHDVPHERGRLQTLLLCAIDDKVAPKSSRFTNMRQRWVERGCTIHGDVRE